MATTLATAKKKVTARSATTRARVSARTKAIPEASASLKPGTKVRLPSKREQEIAQLIVEGFRNQEIAEVLGLSRKTVEAHRSNLYRKLCVDNTAQLIQVVVASGLVKMKGMVVSA